MKAVTTTMLLIALGAVVLAKPTRVERQGHALAHADVRISVVGATLRPCDMVPCAARSCVDMGWPHMGSGRTKPSAMGL